MPIVQTINVYDFRDAFRRMDRAENFSYEGLEVLFEYLEELSDSIGQPVELDVIALCGDYYESGWETLAREYRIELDEEAEEEDKIETVREYLNENTIVCGEPSEGVFVYAVF